MCLPFLHHLSVDYPSSLACLPPLNCVHCMLSNYINRQVSSKGVPLIGHGRGLVGVNHGVFPVWMPFTFTRECNSVASVK